MQDSTLQWDVAAVATLDDAQAVAVMSHTPINGIYLQEGCSIQENCRFFYAGFTMKDACC